MDDEFLIELVRENSELYDFSHRKYCDTNFKNNLWKEIGEKIQQGKINFNIYITIYFYFIIY